MQKTFSEAMIRKLNKACEELQATCNRECDGVAWCQECWEEAETMGKKKKGCGK